MITYFFEHGDPTIVKQISELINKKKERLESEDYLLPNDELLKAESYFESISKDAFRNNDENLANAQFLVKQYLNLLCKLSEFFKLLLDEELSNSWIKLQDCLDIISILLSYSDHMERIDLLKIKTLLKSYESIFPYRVFASTELIISESICSICKQPFNSVLCDHIKGDLYWGKMAQEIIKKVDTIQGISMVTNPRDKRCVLIPKNIDEKDQFQFLHEFMSTKHKMLQDFSIEKNEETRYKDIDKSIKRNELCPCKSGAKYKNCCGKISPYKHFIFTVHEREFVKLLEIPTPTPLSVDPTPTQPDV